jgi:hypothetical protein
VAVVAGFLRGLHVFRLAIRGGGAKQETAKQYGSRQGDFPMGHDASSVEVSNSSTIQLNP